MNNTPTLPSDDERLASAIHRDSADAKPFLNAREEPLEDDLDADDIGDLPTSDAADSDAGPRPGAPSGPPKLSLSLVGDESAMAAGRRVMERSLEGIKPSERALLADVVASQRLKEELAVGFAQQVELGHTEPVDNSTDLMLNRLAATSKRLAELRRAPTQPQQADPLARLTESIERVLERAGGQAAPAGAASAQAAPQDGPALEENFVDAADADLDSETIHGIQGDLDRAMQAAEREDNALAKIALARKRESRERALSENALATTPERTREIVARARKAERIEAVLHAEVEDAERKVVSIELAWAEDQFDPQGGRVETLRSARFVIESEVACPPFSAPGDLFNAKIREWAVAATPAGGEQARSLVEVARALRPDVLVALHPFWVTNALFHACYDAAFSGPGDADRAYQEFLAAPGKTAGRDDARPLSVKNIGDRIMTLGRQAPDMAPPACADHAALFAWAGVSPENFGSQHPGPSALAALHLYRKAGKELLRIVTERGVEPSLPGNHKDVA